MTEDKSIQFPQVKENNKQLAAMLIISGIFVFVMTFIFRLTGYVYNPSTGQMEFTRGAVDIAITSAFYQDGTWFLEEVWFIKLLNENDDVITITIAAISLLMMGFGLSKKERKIWFRYGFFILISTALIAGLVINEIFKGMWGRWRPRHTVFFGGEHPFFAVWEPAWKLDPSSVGEGVSFPSGHVSIVSAYLAFYFVFKHPEFIAHYMGEFKLWKVTLARIFKWLGLLIFLVGSILMGLSRMVVGAHFTSDVFWAMSFTWFLTNAVYYLIFRMPKFERSLIRIKEK